MHQDTITYRSLPSFALVVLVLLSLASCRIDRHLTEDQYLLTGQDIEIHTEDEIINRPLLLTELASLYQQQPNGNLLGIPKEWIYMRYADPGDTSWFDNWARDRVGEPPVLLDTIKTYSAAESMKKYLRNKKGWYHAEVNPKIKRRRKRAKVKYDIDTGPRYYIDSIFYYGKDTAMVDLITSMQDEALLRQGDPADAALFDLEINRIVVNLQNMGYADFVGNYLEVKGDSTGGKHEIDVFIEVISPLPDSIHRKYKVGDINIYTDYYKGQNPTSTDTVTFNGKTYRHELSKILVKPSTIDNNIYLRSGQLLTRRDRTRTYRRLSDINTYRFVAMNAVPDPNRPQVINYDILLTPHHKKWITDAGADVYYSNFTQRQRQLIGVGLRGSLTNRNLLGGSEKYKISGDGGIEFNPIDLAINRYNFRLDNSLEIPKVVDFFSIFRNLRRTRIWSDRRYRKFKRETKTNLSLGYNLIGVVDFYSVSTFNLGVQYQYRLSNKSQVNLATTAFALNNYSLGDDFNEIVGENPLIENSFTDNLVTGYLFNQLAYIYTEPTNSNGFSWSFISDLEISGLETYVANKVYNAISNTDDNWNFLDRFEFSKFVRLELDLRLYKQMRKGHNLAGRINLGLGVPYGESETLPFVKQFSVGGPTSLRAWDQKELGPGGYGDLLLAPKAGQLFYQQGDVLMEFNLEYRFDLFWILEGALFTDIGNVWTLKDDGRGGQIHSKFYQDMAVAAGWGLRFDFEYFNIRFDFGHRLRHPYRDPDTGSHWNQELFDRWRWGNLQVAVNYPF